MGVHKKKFAMKRCFFDLSQSLPPTASFIPAIRLIVTFQERRPCRGRRNGMLEMQSKRKRDTMLFVIFLLKYMAKGHKHYHATVKM